MTFPAAPESPSFHRMARSVPRYRWWRPLTTVLVVIVLYAALMLVAVMVLALLGAAIPAVAATVDQALAENADLRDPGQLAVLLGSIALLWPAVALGTRWGGRRPAGTLSSIEGHLRWRFLPRCLGLAAALFLVVNTVSLLVPATQLPSGQLPDRAGDLTDAWAMLLVVLLLVPLQATAEEYAFRGLLMQAVGSWLRHPAWAVLLPVPLFVAGHGYDWVGQIDIAAFAVAAGWVTWRTGGLEAAIALHVVNNVGVVGLGALGLADPNATELPLAALPFSLVFTLGYCVIVAQWIPGPVRRRSRDGYLASA